MKVINRKARFDYEIGEKIEAGIELKGAEVKSAKAGQADLSRSFVKFLPSKFRNQAEAWVLGMQIFPYKHANNTEYDPSRSRKLLLHQREIVALQSKMRQSRRTLVPTALYTRSGRIKLELALVRGKKKYEKREVLKKREWRQKGKNGGDGGS